MSFVTYILLAGIALGTQDRFVLVKKLSKNLIFMSFKRNFVTVHH